MEGVGSTIPSTNVSTGAIPKISPRIINRTSGFKPSSGLLRKKVENTIKTTLNEMLDNLNLEESIEPSLDIILAPPTDFDDSKKKKVTFHKDVIGGSVGSVVSQEGYQVLDSLFVDKPLEPYSHRTHNSANNTTNNTTNNTKPDIKPDIKADIKPSQSKTQSELKSLLKEPVRIVQVPQNILQQTIDENSEQIVHQIRDSQEITQILNAIKQSPNAHLSTLSNVDYLIGKMFGLVF